MAYLLLMQLLVFAMLALSLYILANHILVRMFPYRRDKISIRPKFSAPQPLLHRRYLIENLSGCNALHLRDDLGHVVRRNRLDKEVDRFSFRPYLQKPYLVSLRYLIANLFEYEINLVTYDKSSLFRYKHETVH